MKATVFATQTGTSAKALMTVSTLSLLALGFTTAKLSAMETPTANGKGPVVNTGTPIELGSYDPYGTFKDDRVVKIEHLFLPWEDVELKSMFEADAYAQQRGRDLLITVEPWSWSQDWRLMPVDLRNAILNGSYDPNMRAICKIAGELKSNVTIRWGQEMEDQDGRFTWSGWRPDDYIKAYRRMVDLCRKEAPKAKYMWSPKGLEGLQAYYPGDNYADSIGLSVFGLQKYDNDKFGRDRTFAELLKPGYDLTVPFNKPIVVAELGYVGKQAYVDNWKQTVTEVEADFPELNAVVYFNDKEVHPWPEGYGRPDWRIDFQVLE
nr:glycosyl hydrolase [uncultured Cohaesibacter sp.]